MEKIEVLNWILGLLTLVASGGWFINYKANKRKSDAEATQQEANGWKAMQEVYEKHFEDMKAITDSVRSDRDHLREDKELLRKENLDWKDRYDKMEDQIRELKREVARLGRKLGIVLPFSCEVAGCPNRRRVNVQEQTDIQVQQETRND